MQTKFDAFLEMPEVLLLPQVNLLQSGTHRTAVQRRSHGVIVAIYKQLYERVNDPASGCEALDGAFPKTPDQVNDLLSN